MKILLFINSLAGGGAERAAATLANSWARRGWNVTLVTLSTQNDDFYALDAHVERVGLDLSGSSSNLLNAVLQNLRRIMALRSILIARRPAVALSLMSTPNVLLAFASRGLPGLLAIGSEHEFPPHAPLGSIWTQLRKKMYGRLGAVVALTQECALWIKKHSSARHVPIIPNAVMWPLPDHPPRIQPDSLLQSGRKVLLAVGRLNKVKNLSSLVQAFSQLAAKQAEWDLVLLGEGPERPLLESMVRNAGLGPRVFMPGIAGNVGDWYACADLYVMTSHSEGFPNTLAEALAHGIPAVSVDCDTGPRDIIRHETDGLLVPPGDASALVDALDRLMGNDGLRHAFAAKALDARERFSVEHITGRWEELFHDLARERFPSTSAGKAQALHR